jgi:hypothetical protein
MDWKWNVDVRPSARKVVNEPSSVVWCFCCTVLEHIAMGGKLDRVRAHIPANPRELNEFSHRCHQQFQDFPPTQEENPRLTVVKNPRGSMDGFW